MAGSLKLRPRLADDFPVHDLREAAPRMEMHALIVRIARSLDGVIDSLTTFNGAAMRREPDSSPGSDEKKGGIAPALFHSECRPSQAAAVATERRRRARAPSPPIPKIIIVQVAGSGTAPVSDTLLISANGGTGLSP